MTSKQSISNYLKAHTYDKSKHASISNTRIGDKDSGIYGGSYHIPDEEYPEFIKLYGEQIIAKNKCDYLTEKQLENNGGILIDVDMRFDTSIKTRQYTQDHINNLFDTYLDTLKEVYQFDEDTQFPIYILEKPNVNCLEDKTKDGIHMVIGIQAARTTQILLRQKMLPKLEQVFEGLPLTNSWDEVLDEGISIGSTNWQLFGSKKPNHESYQLTQAYSISFDTNDSQFRIVQENLGSFDLQANLFKLSARYPNHYTTFFKGKFADEIAEFQKKKGSPKGNPKANLKASNETKKESETGTTDTNYDEMLVKLAIEKGLMTEFAKKYDDWRPIGYILKNTFVDDEMGWNLFDTFSKLADTGKIDSPYKPEKNRELWDSWEHREKVDNPKGYRLGIGALVDKLKKKDKSAFAEIEKQLKSMRKKDAIEAKDSRYALDENQAAGIIVKEIKDILIASSDGRLFYNTNNIWKCDKSVIDDHILNYILESEIYKFGDDGEKKSYVQNVTTAENVRKAVYAKIRTRTDAPDIYEKFHTTTKTRLCFKDGVLDFKEKKFYKWEEIEFEYFSTVMIPLEYASYFENPHLETVATVKQTVYENLFGQKTTRALNYLSRAIAGHTEDKNWATFLGNRNCGKGVLYDNLESAFGTSYVKTFELSNILYERSTNTEEISRKLYWLLDFEFARIGISQETPPPSSQLKANGKMIKKMAGGGDKHVARRNFDRVDTHFKIDSTFLFLGNNELVVDVKDTLEHRIAFSSVSQYKSQGEIDIMREEGLAKLNDKLENMRNDGVYDLLIQETEKKGKQSIEMLCASFKIKDPKLKNLCVSDEWKKATIYLIYQHYIETALISDTITADADDNEKLLRQCILDNFDITLDIENDFILVTEVEDTISDCRKKIKNELESLGVIKKKSKQRDNTRDKMCYFGLKKK